MYKSLNAGLVNIASWRDPENPRNRKGLDFASTVKLAKKHGFNAIEYSPASIMEEGLSVNQVQDVLGQEGMHISNFGIPIQMMGKERFQETFPKLEPVAALAAKFGIHRCLTWIPASSNDLEFAENFKLHTWMMRLICTVLKDYDISIGLEFLGPKGAWTRGTYPFIHTMPGMLELCDAVGTGNIGVLLDAHHAFCSGLKGDDFVQYVREEKDIVIVHLNQDKLDTPVDEITDSPRYYPGEEGGGANDLKAFMKGLVKVGYTGPVIAEPNSATINAMTDNDAIAKIISESTDSVWPN
ncbi:MAG: sugar phosphate isomerase/epimerase [Treponema sp.]|nr:sugar phosphate isomerase/epimerase [Treponema sp.]